MALGTQRGGSAALRRIKSGRPTHRLVPSQTAWSEAKQAEMYARCAAGLEPLDEAPAVHETARFLWRMGLALPFVAMLMLYKAICTASLPELAGNPTAVAWIAVAGLFSVLSLGCGLAAVAKGAGAWGSLAQAMGGGTFAMSLSVYMLGAFFARLSIAG